ANHVGDAALAARVRPMLEPYQDLFVDNASTFFGSVHLFSAMCSSVLGDVEVARSSFERATSAHERIASPPLLARTRLEHAAMRCAMAPADASGVELATAALIEA